MAGITGRWWRTSRSATGMALAPCFPRFASLAQSRRSLGLRARRRLPRPPPVCGVSRSTRRSLAMRAMAARIGGGGEVLLEGLPLGAEGFAGEGEAEAPGDHAEQGEQGEAPQVHAGDAGGEADEGPDQGDQAAQEYDGLAPAFEPGVRPVHLVGAQQEVSAPPVDRRAAAPGPQGVGEPGAHHAPGDPPDDHPGRPRGRRRECRGCLRRRPERTGRPRRPSPPRKGWGCRSSRAASTGTPPGSRCRRPAVGPCR